MFEVRFSEHSAQELSAHERAVIVAEAQRASDLARSHLPLPDRLQLLVELSTAVLDITGDNAYTVSPELIRWRVDPARGVVDVCRARLAKSLLHEAYHAARFRRLPEEANGRTWLEISIGEGLATAFARDFGAADEPWADYDENAIHAWAQELLATTSGSHDLGTWKFQHPDGRQWIAFRVGTWLVDQICKARSTTPPELVWIPVEELAGSLPPDLRGQSETAPSGLGQPPGLHQLPRIPGRPDRPSSDSTRRDSDHGSTT